MKSKLYIQCTDQFEQGDVTIVGPNNAHRLIDNVELKTLSEKFNLNDYDINVLMITPDIVFKEVVLPKGINTATLQKIIPNVAEENMISSIENMHFVFSKVDKTHCMIAWVEKVILNEWLETLRSFSIEPVALYSTVLALGGEPFIWRAWIQNGLASVQISPTQGFTIETELLPKLLTDFFLKAELRPEKIEIISSEDVSALKETLLPELQTRTIFTKAQRCPIVEPRRSGLNLLMHEFDRTNQQGKFKWLMAHSAVVALVIIGFLIAQQIIYVVKFSEISNQQTAQIEAIYKRMYPNATQVTSPKQRIEQEIKQIAAQSPFYDLLYRMGGVLKQNKAVMLKSMNYNAQKMKITLEAENYTEVEAVVKELKVKKLKVEQNKAEQKLNKLNAEFTISKEP